MYKKRAWGIFGLFITCLVLLSLLNNLSFVSAVPSYQGGFIGQTAEEGNDMWQWTGTEWESYTSSIDDEPTSTSVDKCDKYETKNFFTKYYCLWLKGSGAREFGLAVEFTKWLMVIIVFILTFSALTYVRIPQGKAPRIILSFIVGILSTFLITAAEILTALQSYSALGISLFVFLPILILGAFTFMISVQINPVGLVIQRILWLIYSIYLFFKSLVLWILLNSNCAGTSSVGKSCTGLIKYLHAIFIKPFYSQQSIDSMVKSVGSIGGYDNTVLILLLVVAVASFVLMVLMNKILTAWISKQELVSEKEADKGEVERARNWTQTRANDMQKAGKE